MTVARFRIGTIKDCDRESGLQPWRDAIPIEDTIDDALAVFPVAAWVTRGTDAEELCMLLNAGCIVPMRSWPPSPKNGK